MDSLYQSVTSEAEFLGEMRPLGYGPRVESLIAEARTLDTAAKDPYELRQLLVSSLGFFGARKPIELEQVDADVTAAEVLPDLTHVVAGLRNGKLVLFDLSTGRKIAEHDCLSVPAVGIDVELPDDSSREIRIRVHGRGSCEVALWTWAESGRLTLVRTTRPNFAASFYPLQKARRRTCLRACCQRLPRSPARTRGSAPPQESWEPKLISRCARQHRHLVCRGFVGAARSPTTPAAHSHHAPIRFKR